MRCPPPPPPPPPPPLPPPSPCYCRLDQYGMAGTQRRKIKEKDGKMVAAVSFSFVFLCLLAAVFLP